MTVSGDIDKAENVKYLESCIQKTLVLIRMWT